MPGVLSETRDGVGIVTLDEPAHRNSLTLPMVAELSRRLDALEADDTVGAVVVTGTPPAFCAGADLAHLAGEAGGPNGPDREQGLRAIYEGFLRVSRSPLPTVAAVNGAAVGAGMNLALACDVRVAARRARFDTRFLQLGLHPGGGHTWMLRRAVGPQTAAAMVLFGEELDGAAAADCGLAWRCVADEDVVDAAVALAARAAAAPRALVSRTKQTMQGMALVPDHDTAVEVELQAQLWSLGQPEFAERLAALAAKITSR
jgi:enoyl-CoA hydratase